MTFIATANRKKTIPPPLRDRTEMIVVGGYTEVSNKIIAFSLIFYKLNCRYLTRGVQILTTLNLSSAFELSKVDKLKLDISNFKEKINLNNNE